MTAEKKRGRGRPKTTGTTAAVQFRLTKDVLEKLVAIEKHHTAATGTPIGRAAAVRIAIHNEWKRVTRAEGDS